ncbi:hypothetical protein [Mycobacterium vicinigordonae]|uniref:Uncharacterized protein n=1 Tax=Mycobacterium vicinigordonae TaxID=1719132 RepID=A0A7D6HRD3_9MYCO|nr:hypothetical protein [Mycobacterium vicinigordonae]QLL05532.1 hypothetical protein H0P51_16930 [Mycobacterium vicinigordonae]
MSRSHADVGSELRRLAQAILDGIDPGVRAAATLASSTGPGKCQQVWCPVCALAAVVSGEQHPLVTVIASHSVALLEVVRAIVDDIGDAAASAAPDDASPGGGEGAQAATGPVTGHSDGNGGGAAKTRYQAIPVALQD